MKIISDGKIMQITLKAHHCVIKPSPNYKQGILGALDSITHPVPSYSAPYHQATNIPEI